MMRRGFIDFCRTSKAIQSQPPENTVMETDSLKSPQPQSAKGLGLDAPPCCVLFLDVDGVLNLCGKSHQGLHTDKCDLLAYVCRKTGCKIVVSSTWRKYPHLMERLNGMFRARGIDCIGVTPDLTSSIDHSVLVSSVSRHIEIREWLMQNPSVKCYAIIDDDRDADDGTGRYVKTDSYEGMLDSHATALMQILTHNAESRRDDDERPSI